MDNSTREEKERAAMGGVFSCRYDPEWTVVKADESLFRFLGYTREEFKEKFDNKMAGVIDPDDMQPMYETVERQLKEGNTIFNENRLHCADGSVKWIWIAAELMQNEEYGKFFYCMFYDITKDVLRREQLAQSENRYAMIMQQTQDTVFEWNCLTDEVYCSPNFERKFGYKPPSTGPHALLETDVVHPDDREMFLQYIEKLERGSDGVVFECRMRKLDGTFLWVRIHTVLIRGADGSKSRMLGIISDIQEQKQSMLAAEKLANRDPLTNLYNHKATETLISRYLAAGEGKAAFLVIDVDNFKGINDTLGHIYGDAVLSDLAFQLKKLFRASDVVGRVGGDEFVVFMQDLAQPESVDRKAAEIMGIFHRALSNRGVSYEITGSIGAAFFPEDGRTYQELFEKADLAMYHSKNNGKNQFTFYNECVLTERTRPHFGDGRIDTADVAPKNLRDNVVEYLFRIFLENPDVEEACRLWFECRGALSGQLCPIKDRERLAGFVGYECFAGVRRLSEEDHDTLALAAEAISLTLMRTRKQEQLQRQMEFSERVDFINENIPGGTIGVYLEEGFPLCFINDRMLEYLGYSDEAEFFKAIGGLVINSVYGEDRQMVKSEVDRQMREAGEYEVVYRMLKKDGSYIWVKDIGRIAGIENGRPTTISLCIDVTEQIALQNQLALYRKSSRGGAFVVRIDDDFTLLYGNDIYYNVHEYTKESMKERLGNRCAQYIHPEDLPNVKSFIGEALMAGKTSAQWEMRVITGTGEVRWILTSGTFEYKGGELVMNGFVTDISESQKLREEIARNEERYRIALRQTNTNVWEYDINAKTITMTESAQLRHGFTGVIEGVPESLMEQGHIHPSSYEDYKEMYQKLREGEKRVQADILTRTADRDGWWWERITYTSIFDEKGKVVRAVAVGEDITRQKEAELRYQQELQLRYALSEGVIASSRLNLTRNRVEYLQMPERPKLQATEDITYEQLFQTALEAVANANDRKRFAAAFSETALNEAVESHTQMISLEYRRTGVGGRIKWVNSTLRLVKDAVTGELYAYGIIRNIDNRKSLELTLAQRAEKDTVTNIYSRETAIRMIEEVLTLAEKERRGYAFLLFDIDNFSHMIKQNGYVVAEDAMRELTELIGIKFGLNQISGRFYEDEVAVFVQNGMQVEELQAAAAEICSQIEHSVIFADAKVPVIVHVGIVPGREGKEFKALYDEAHAALEEARTLEERRCSVYSGQTPTGRRIKNERGTQAILSGGFQPDAQAILLRSAFSLTSSLVFQDAVDPILEDLGTYYQSDRAYLLMLEKDYQSEAYYEWLREGISSKRMDMDDFVSLRAAAMEDGFALTGADGLVLGYLGLDHPERQFNRQELLEPVCQFLSNELTKRLMQEKQKYLSYHDSLTGLLNRNSFVDYSRSLREESLISLGVVSVDINGLKRMNSRYGNRFGDEMVRRTARCMKEAFAGGSVYRFAGDEFLAVCENLAHEAFVSQITVLRGLMADPAGCISIGYVWSDEDIRLDSMMIHADEKMLIAKKEYYKTLDTMTKGYDPVLFKNLKTGMERNAFKMFLQPKAQIQTGDIVGAEALVRCYDPEAGLLGPDKFVPMLEKEGLIRYIDLFMFESVCRTFAEWKEKGWKLLPISVNFSRATLLEERLIDTMEELRSRYGVEPSLIEIEITESLGEMERETVAYISRQIRERGYRLSLDDFGAKYSSLAVLSIMELDVLKVDKSLVNDLLSNGRTKVLLGNLLSVCRKMGIETVAEGVETKEQLQILQELNCDLAQGYYFNKAIPREDFEKAYLG